MVVKKLRLVLNQLVEVSSSKGKLKDRNKEKEYENGGGHFSEGKLMGSVRCCNFVMWMKELGREGIYRSKVKDIIMNK